MDGPVAKDTAPPEAVGAGRGWEATLGRAIAISSLVIVVAVAVTKWSEWSALLSDANVAPLVAALALGLLGQFLNSVIAFESLRLGGSPIPLRSVYRIITVGGLAKFIPGGVWQIGSQYGLGRSEGLDFRSSMLAWIEPTAFNVAIGGGLALLAATTVDYGVSALLLVPAALCCFLASTNPVRHRIYRLVRLTAPEQDQARPYEGWGLGVTVTVAIIALTGVGGMLIVEAFNLPNPGFLGCVAAFVGAWVVGVLVFPVPGGLGVREGALIIALSPWLSAPEAVLVATAGRLVAVAAELLAAMVGISIRPACAAVQSARPND